MRLHLDDHGNIGDHCDAQLVTLEVEADATPASVDAACQEAKRYLRQDQCAVVVDFAAVEQPKRSELILLLTLQQFAKRQHLRLFICCLSTAALQTLKALGVEGVVPIYPDREAARAAAVAALSPS